MKNSKLSYAIIACVALGVSSAQAWAEEASSDQPAAPPSGDQPAAPTSNAMTQPAMAGPLAANPNPVSFEAGPLGKVYVTGVASGLGLVQSNHVPGDKSAQADISNGQVILQTTEGLVQFYAQAGVYSLPDLGLPYVRATKTIDNLYGPLPVAFVKLAPSDTFSIQAGKLPTLIGAETTFDFQNPNIERGLLWNQESAVSQGVQANYTMGPLALSFAVTDGFYSGHLDWLSGSAAYTINSSNVVTFVGGANTQTNGINTIATPATLNSEQIYNLIYAYTSGPWTVNPYLQYTYVPKNTTLGITHDASTYGGAVLATYNLEPEMGVTGVSLPVRLEYIKSTGSASDGSPNLMYGPGSSAWSVTVTPTYQHNIFFARAELSYVGVSNIAAGAAFGTNGNEKSQVRGVLEAGVVF